MTHGFSRVRLRNILEERSGITWSAEQESLAPHPDTLPVLTVTNVQETLRTEPMLYIRGVTDRDRERKAAKQGWTLAVGSNGNRTRIGNCVFIEHDTEYLFASFLVGFRPKPDSGIDPEYFYRWMSSYEVQARLSASAEGTTGLGNLSGRYFRNMWIEYPSDPKEQRRITEVLRHVDRSIAAARESISRAEVMQKGLMQQLLTGRLNPNGTLRSSQDFVPDKEFAQIPRSWRSCKFKDLLREGAITGIQDGNHGEKHPRKEDYVMDGIPFIMACDISSGEVDLENAKRIPKQLADDLRIGFSVKDDVLLSHKASIGFTAIVDDVDPYIMLTPQVTYYRCNPDLLLPKYLNLFFRSYRFQRVLDALSAQSTRNYIGITNQKGLPILYPPDVEEQKAIAVSLGTVDDLIRAKRKKIASLQRLKKSLMQNLLTGRVRWGLKDAEEALV